MIFDFLKESSWINPQIDYLLYLQTLRGVHPFLDQFFIFITNFGGVAFPLIFMCAIYWCIDSKKGIYLFLLSCYSSLLAQFLKMSACIYRPWVINPAVKPPGCVLEMSYGYSFPSGHSATAMSVWGGSTFAFWKNKIASYVMIALILLVGFSRLYLGVHTPQDVIVSFVAAFILIFLVHYLILWFESGKNRDIIVFITTCLLTIGIIAFVFLKNYPIDYLNGGILVDPNKIKIGVLTNSGYAFGIFTGWLLERRFVKFDASYGSIIEKIIRFTIGIAILLLLQFLFSSLGNYIGFYAKFISNFTCAIFIIFLYPLFLNLCNRSN
jgi:membrane-associated phospholipid phosphatase